MTMNYHLPVRVVRAATAAALLASIAVTALCASSHQASAADPYPTRRITFVVPYPAGGATDVLARLLANKLKESWKQTVLIENKSGGGGVVVNDYVAKAQPDGHTVLIAITQIIQAPSLVGKLPYDVFKDLAPVTQIALSTIVLVVPEQSRSSPSRSWSILPRQTPASLTAPSATPRRPTSTANCSRRPPIST